MTGGLLGLTMLVRPASSEGADADALPIADGPATPAIESLRDYVVPPWFADAEFGIRVNWGPQNLPEQGDGYARNFQVPGRRHHDYHREHFGDPQQVGYRAVVERWTGERFDPGALTGRFKAAGARYVVVQAVDRDGFDLWNSRHQPWNARNAGPKRDVVGAWAEAARAQGLRWGVSEHLAAAYERPGGSEAAGDTWPRQWYLRIADLIDQHRPDLLLLDEGVPFGEVGRSLLAHYYNRSLEWQEDLTVVAGLNRRPENGGEYVPDIAVELIPQGSQAAVASRPWICETLLNDRVYDRAMPMRPATAVIHQLVDVVSKNGSYLLNVPLRGDGSLPEEAGAVLDEIAAWFAVGGEAVFGTHPWHLAGEGPTETVGGPMGEKQTLPYTPEDIRFTVRPPPPGVEGARETLYAIVLGWPGAGEEVVISALAQGPKAWPVATVQLLGHRGALRVVRDRAGLHIQLPRDAPSRHAIVFRID